MQKENHLLRMRRSGWFDIMMLFLAFALVLGVLGLVGVISYHNAMGRVTEDMTEYEITHSLSALARARSTYLTAAAVCLGVAAVGLLCLRFISPLVQTDPRRQMAMRRTMRALQ